MKKMNKNESSSHLIIAQEIWIIHEWKETTWHDGPYLNSSVLLLYKIVAHSFLSPHKNKEKTISFEKKKIAERRHAQKHLSVIYHRRPL